MSNEVEVPMYSATGATGATGTTTVEPKSAGRILIVDDDYSIRRALHMTLYAQGFEVAEASSGNEAPVAGARRSV